MASYGIPMAPRGVPQIEVAFDIDANGIVNVSAKDLGTGREQSITISGSTALDDAEIERMVEDAKRNAAEDERRKADIDRLNGVDALAYSVEQTLSSLGERVPSDVADDARAAVKRARDAVSEKDFAAAEKAEGDLKSASERLASIAYGNGGTVSGNSAGSASGASDDVVEADYEVVDENGERR